MTRLPDFPMPQCEPENAYRPGTADHAALQAALGSHEIVEIPTVINGKEYFSNNVVDVRSPHNHQRVIARFHRPTEAQHREAIVGSIKAAQDWANPRHALMNDELFGPVLTVFVYDDRNWADMFAIIDSTSPYVLTGSI